MTFFSGHLDGYPSAYFFLENKITMLYFTDSPSLGYPSPSFYALSNSILQN